MKETFKQLKSGYNPELCCVRKGVENMSGPLSALALLREVNFSVFKASRPVGIFPTPASPKEEDGFIAFPSGTDV